MENNGGVLNVQVENCLISLNIFNRTYASRGGAIYLSPIGKDAEFVV